MMKSVMEHKNKAGGKTVRGSEGEVASLSVQEGHTEKVTCEKSLKEVRKEANHTNTYRKTIAGRDNSLCKEPQLIVCQKVLRNCEEDSG